MVLASKMTYSNNTLICTFEFEMTDADKSLVIKYISERREWQKGMSQGGRKLEKVVVGRVYIEYLQEDIQNSYVHTVWTSFRPPLRKSSLMHHRDKNLAVHVRGKS